MSRQPGVDGAAQVQVHLRATRERDARQTEHAAAALYRVRDEFCMHENRTRPLVNNLQVDKYEGIDLH
jgi:hypothetical protein